jgi:hypothetical protein
MFPTHYQKMPIKYDPFSKMFHKNIKILEENFETSNCDTNEMEKFGLTRRTYHNQYQTDSRVDINESVIINENEKCNNNNNNNRISNIQIRSMVKTGFNNNNNININNKDFNKENNIYQITSSKFNFNLNSNNRNKKKSINFDGKKTYYDKNYLFQDHKNDENDIVSNFNIHKDIKFNQLIYTNKFSEVNNNYKSNIGFNNYMNNKFNGIALLSNNNNSISNNDENSSLNNNNNDGKKSYMQKLSTIGNKEKCPFVDLKEDNTIKNSFYYSLRGRLKKNNLVNNININNGQGNNLMSNVNLLNLNNLNNMNNFNTNSRENTINKMFLGNSFTNLSNGNNNNIELSIDEANLYKEINPQGQYNHFQVKNQNLNVDNSINDISSYRKYNEIKKNNLINKEKFLLNKNFNNGKLSNGREFFKNFNLINKKNNINSNYISRSVEPKKEINYITKENFYKFPKLKKPLQENTDNVLKGVFNVVELKSKFKRIKR